MKELGDPQSLIEQIREQIKKLNEFVQSLDQQISEKNKEKEDAEKLVADVLSEGNELKEILDNCDVDVCQYKTAFENIRNKYSEKLEKDISNQQFHFFLCYRGDYYSRGEKSVIDSHQEIINRYGSCWWGKFVKERLMGGAYKELEPFGESINIGENSTVARKIKDKVKERISNGDHINLYIYNPNPPVLELYVCNVIDFYYGEQKIPYIDVLDKIPPECQYVPRYYFHSREGNCVSCKGYDIKKCNLKFLSNFWFKIDRISKLDKVEDEFVNLVNCFTKDSINFAIPILYPLLVNQKEQRFHFQDLVEPITYESGYELFIPEKEKGHTKTDKVKNFFDELNKKCKESFVRVESIKCGGPYSGIPKLRKTDKNNEILIDLPAEYRGDNKAVQFKIHLDKSTKPEQKKKVEELIGISFSD